jgi:hypothetical protein
MKKIFASVTLAAFMLVGATAFAYTQDPPPAADAAKKKSSPKKKKTTTDKTEPAKDAVAKPTPAPKAAPKKK